jgi:DNA-binding transcriptional LysR family regulator
MKTKHIDALWSHLHWLGVLDMSASYTAAAKRLGVSKAAVSHRITELEQAAGVPLVRRTTRSVQLTEAGKHLVTSTRDSFSSIERCFTGLREQSVAPSGLLRVTAPVALGRQHVVPRVASFLAKNPGVRIEMELSDELRSLAQDGFDLAIRHVETVPDTHVAWVLCETETLLVASESYIEKKPAPRIPSDLSSHNCLYYLRGNPEPTWTLHRRRGKKERVAVPVRGTFVANNSETLRDLAVAGTGIAMLPDFSAADLLQAGRLVRVLPDWRPIGAFGRNIFAIRPYSPQVPRAAQAFVAHLRDALWGGFPTS